MTCHIHTSVSVRNCSVLFFGLFWFVEPRVSQFILFVGMVQLEAGCDTKSNITGSADVSGFTAFLNTIVVPFVGGGAHNTDASRVLLLPQHRVFRGEVALCEAPDVVHR